MTALSILVLVFIIGSAICAILSQTKPNPILLVLSILLICVAVAVLSFGGVEFHR